MCNQWPTFVTGLHPTCMLQAPTNPEADCALFSLTIQHFTLFYSAGGIHERRSCQKNWPNSLWYDTNRIEKDTSRIIQCRENIFTALLPRNDRGILRQTNRHTLPTILVLLRVFIPARSWLPSRCLAMIEGIHVLWSAPLTWDHVSWHTCLDSERLV